MNTLLKKELVYERGKPMKRYALTEEGWEVARAINQADAVKNGTAVAGPAHGPPRNTVQEEDDDDILDSIQSPRDWCFYACCCLHRHRVSRVGIMSGRRMYLSDWIRNRIT